MVKFFGFIDGKDLENRINEWSRSDLSIRITLINYQTQIIEREVWHFALVSYQYDKYPNH